MPGYDYSGALDALSAYEQTFGRRELVNRLYRELLVEEARPGEVHEAFCRLRFDRVVTTNLEFLIEEGYRRAGERCEAVIDEDQLPIPASRSSTVLLKLHGDLRHPAQLVVTEDDYDGFLARNPVLATHVSSLLIERVPIFIGYSLDDPDFRQLLSVLRDRLGKMLPLAYAVTVGANAVEVARYERRGVRVLNLDNSKAKYAEVLTAAFRELDEYWREHVLEEVEFLQERPLEELRVSPSGENSRLCYFSVPRNLIAFYRNEVFPMVEEVGLVPVSGFDVETEPGNQLAAAGALIERASCAIVDVGEGTGSVELGIAVSAIGSENVLVVTAGEAPPAFADRLEFVLRPDSIAEENEAFLEVIWKWMQFRMPVEAPGLNAMRLLELKEWTAALIASVAEMEALLQELFPEMEHQKGRPRRRRRTLRQILATEDLPIEPAVKERLLADISLRNSVLHEGARVSPRQAKSAVEDVAALRRSL
ncbi:MAG TPA: SIR2 family protein [Solirubrobacterales bacterium]|nr:SIR2 family protein [Solirubrobacterales bacterium]